MAVGLIHVNWPSLMRVYPCIMLICVTSEPDSANPLAKPEAAPEGLDTVLDDPQEWAAFSEQVKARSTTGGVTSGQDKEWCSYISIEGMHCAACALNVESALLGVPGVSRAEVDAASKRARVQWRADQVQPSQWFEAVKRAGYEAIPAHDPLSRLKRQHETRLVVWQWAVAGFCMMQVMMYAAPEYVDRGADIPWDSLQLLHWAGWVLSLPVLVFSCTPYWKSAWHDLKARRIGMDLPVALGMAITFGVSTLATFEPAGWWGSTVYFDSFTMFVFFLLTGRWLTLRLRDRTAGALDEVLNRLPDVVQREGEADGQVQWQTVGIRQLRVGDVVRVSPGERFVADGVLLDSGTWVEEALLTGESHPQQRKPGDQVLAGSHNLSERVRVRITGLGADTRYAQIVGLMHDAALDKPGLAQMADRWAKPFLWGVIVAALGAFWVGAAQGLSHGVMAAASVLIVTCPCALSLATPSALLAAAGRLARQGVLVRKVQVMETLAQIDTVVFDKTGTLTTGLTDLRTVWSPASEQGMALRAQGLDALDEASLNALGLVGAVAESSAHPVSRALANHASEKARARILSVREWPGLGLEAQIRAEDGTVKVLRIGSLDHLRSAGPRAQPPESARDATVHVALDDQWRMSLHFSERIRPDAPEAIRRLVQRGLQVRLMSGDRPEQVQRVADELGLSADHAMGHCTPTDKLNQIKRLQSQGHRLLMVGDGFNDMPVLAGADVSMAFAKAVPLAQAHADVVNLGDRLDEVPELIELSVRTMSVIRGSLLWALIYNLVSIPLAVVGGLPPAVAGLGMAASSLWVVLRALPLNKTKRQTAFV